MRKFFISYAWYYRTSQGFGNVFVDLSGSQGQRVTLAQPAIEAIFRWCEADLMKLHPEIEEVPRIIVLFFHELEA